MTMYKRGICCFLAVLLLAGLLAGCGGKKTAQKPDRDDRPSNSQEREKPDREESDWLESEWESQAETTRPLEDPEELVDDGMLVTDIYWDEVVNYEYDYLYCYHIPQINVSSPDVAILNGEIYDLCYGILEESVYSYGDEPYVIGMAYVWGRLENLLTLNIQVTYNWGSCDYHLFYVDLKERTVLDTEEVLEFLGMPESEYQRLLSSNLERKFLELYGQALEYNREFDGFAEHYNSQQERTLAQENLDNAMPYIDRSGDLCCVVKIFSMAGADSYFHLINLSGGTDPQEQWCNGNHEPIQPEEPAGDMGQMPETYAGFIADGGYEPYLDGSDLCGDVTQYAIVDVNQDGILELFLDSGDGFGFFMTYIFTMDRSGRNVIYLGSIYNYGGLAYSQRDRCITYCYPRPTVMEGGRDFYLLENGEFVRAYGLYFTNYTEYRLVTYSPDGSVAKDESLTEAQWNEWMEADLPLEWKEIG